MHHDKSRCVERPVSSVLASKLARLIDVVSHVPLSGMLLLRSRLSSRLSRLVRLSVWLLLFSLLTEVPPLELLLFPTAMGPLGYRALTAALRESHVYFDLSRGFSVFSEWSVEVVLVDRVLSA